MNTDKAPAQNDTPSIDKSSVLYKWFKTLLDNSTLEVREEELNTCIKNELRVDFNSLNQALRLVLPQMFTIYMRNWVGWDCFPDYKAGKITIDHYFLRFHKYVTSKLNKCVKGDFLVTVNELKKNNIDVDKLKSTEKTKNAEVEKSSGGVLKSASGPKEVYAPYTLLVKCPPQMMSTIVFTNNKDDVVLKHHMGKEWKALNTSQLINWPNITVTYLSEDLYFIRSHECHYHRYLNFAPHDCEPNRKGPVESIEHACRRLPRACYSYQLLEAYCKEFIGKLKLLQHGSQDRDLEWSMAAAGCSSFHLADLICGDTQLTGDLWTDIDKIDEYSFSGDVLLCYPFISLFIACLTPEKFEEIETVLNSFLEDVKMINQNSSIASNTKILFRLSQTSFFRNKKLLKSDSSDRDPARVGYCEVITPKIELLLKSFKAQQLGTPEIKFESTERMDGYQKMLKETLRHILPKIYYRCNFCFKDFYTLTAQKEVLEHLVKEHRMEQPVRCTQCKKQFDVLSLTSYRWHHKCNHGQE